MATGQEVGRQSEADLSNRVVTATGSTTARAMKDRAADVLNVLDFGAACNGSTVDTTAIQAALTRANVLGGRRVFIPASTVIDAALIIYSNTWLEVAPQATVKVNASTIANMLKNRAVSTPQRTVTDAAITVSTTTLTSATATFTSADVGRTVQLAGAGAGGDVLSANITVFTNATTVTVSVAAGTSVTGANLKIYDRDVNIKITGGIWDRGNASGTGSDSSLHTLLFYRLDGLTIRDVTMKQTNAKYAIAGGDVTNAVLERIDGAVNSALIQFIGPASRITVRDVRGTTGDDTVAFVARDYVAYRDTTGDISDILVDGVAATSSQALVKVMGGTGTVLRRATIRNVYGTATWAAVTALDDTTGPSDIGGLLVDGVSAAVAATTGVDVSLRPSLGRDVIVRNVKPVTSTASRTVIRLGIGWEAVVIDGVQITDSVAGTGASIVACDNTTTLGKLTISHVQGKMLASSYLANVSSTITSLAFSDIQVQATQANVLELGSNGNVTDLSMTGVQLDASDTNVSIVLHVTGTLGGYTLSNVRMMNGRRLITSEIGSVVGPGRAVGVFAKGCGRLIDANTNMDITLSALSLDSPAAAAIFANNGATVTVRGGGINRITAWAGVEKGGTGTNHFRIINPDYPADVSIVDMNDGDMAYNTSATPVTGAGRVVNNGGAWKRLHLQRLVSADRGDTAQTLQVGADVAVQVWATSLTADRAVTLGITGVANGDAYRIVRTAGNTGGPWNLNVGTGPLKALTVNTWCEVTYNGSAWVLTGYGAL